MENCLPNLRKSQIACKLIELLRARDYSPKATKWLGKPPFHLATPQIESGSNSPQLLPLSAFRGYALAVVDRSARTGARLDTQLILIETRSRLLRVVRLKCMLVVLERKGLPNGTNSKLEN
jgi:hypothetical protein